MDHRKLYTRYTLNYRPQEVADPLTSRNTWLACSYLPFSDGQAVQSCRVQSEDVKNESKGLQETGLPANPLTNRLLT